MTRAEELGSWIRLMGTDGVGPQTARELLTRFGLPSEIFDAGFSALQKCVSEKVAYAICAPVSDALQAKIDRTLAWEDHAENHVLTLADAHYPKALLNIGDPPPILYAKGDISLLTRPAVAIVGSLPALLVRQRVQLDQLADTAAQLAQRMTLVSDLPDFDTVPRVIADSLLFIEDRYLLDANQPNRNPAIDWGRCCFSCHRTSERTRRSSMRSWPLCLGTCASPSSSVTTPG
mgnify:CR=1 FL=1